MSKLYERIKAAVDADRVLVSWHADEQCEHRKVETWQVVAGVAEANVVNERPASKPNPSIVLEQQLLDGTSVRTVWAWLDQSGRAKLVTVFFPE